MVSAIMSRQLEGGREYSIALTMLNLSICVELGSYLLSVSSVIL